MANILDAIKGQLSDSLIEQVSGQLGESKSGVSSALSGMIPTILGGMINKAESPSGFGQIFDLIKNQGNADLLGNLGSLINQGNLAQNDPKDAGGQLMGALFGNKVGSILGTITSMAGLNSRSSSSSLLGLAAPLIMGYLKKRILGDNLGASGLASMLLGQKDSIMSSIPAGLAGTLGFAAPKVNTTSTTTTTTTTQTASTGGGSFWKWLLPLLLIGAAALYFLKGCDPQATMEDASAKVENAAGAVAGVAGDAANAAGDAVGNVADAAGDAVNGAADAVASLFKRKLPSGVEIEANADGVESQLITFVEGDNEVDKTTWFNFDALNFKTASAELDMDYSQAQINNLAAIMKAFPELKLKIGGYTDSDGDEAMNMKLSQARAENVVNAIVAKGIDASRLAAEGYGEAHPLCPANDTPECKAQNRRIAVRVTAK